MLYGLPIIEIDISGCVNLIIELNTSLQLKAQKHIIDTTRCMHLYRYLKEPSEGLFTFDICIAYDAPLRVSGFCNVDGNIHLALERTEVSYIRLGCFNPDSHSIVLNKDTVTVLLKMLEIHLGDLVNGL